MKWDARGVPYVDADDLRRQPEVATQIEAARRVLSNRQPTRRDLGAALASLHWRLQQEPMDDLARLCMVDEIEDLIPDLRPLSEDYRQMLADNGGV